MAVQLSRLSLLHPPPVLSSTVVCPSNLLLLHFCWPVYFASLRSTNTFRRPYLLELHFYPRDFFPCVVLSVKHVWPTEGQKHRSVWSLSVVFPSGCEDSVHVVSLTFLWHVPRVLFFPPFSCLPSIAFALEQSLEISKYLSTFHLSTGAAAGPSVENLAPRFLPTVSTKPEFYNIFSFSPIPSLLTSGAYNPSTIPEQSTNVRTQKKKKKRKQAGGRTTTRSADVGMRKICVRV